MNMLEKVISRLQREMVMGGSMRAAEALKAKSQTHRAEYVLARCAKESSIRGAISESCAEWVKNGSLPLMTPEDALYFYDRLFYGCGLGRMLLQSGFLWNGEESKLLLWLLIDSWDRITCLTWKWNLENQI